MKPRTGLRWLVPFLAAVPLAFAASAHAQKTTLTVYTALETDQLKAYQEGFNKANPDIELVWVRDSTGVITAKLLAEKVQQTGIDQQLGPLNPYERRLVHLAVAEVQGVATESVGDAFSKTVFLSKRK